MGILPCIGLLEIVPAVSNKRVFLETPTAFTAAEER